MMGGQLAHEFMYLTSIGEDTLLLCDGCGYAANRQIACFAKPSLQAEAPLPVEKVATPGTKTIEDLANFLGVSHAQTAKAVFMVATIPEGQQKVDRFVFAVVRGDMEVNETKLGHAVKATELRPATEEEIRAAGAVPGYASPVGLKNVLVVVDDLIPGSANLVSGANQDGYHLRNVNHGRDYQADIIADITAAREGDACLQCGEQLRAVRGVEVGNIFKLGTRYSESLGCIYLDQAGQSRPIIMGSYGIGSGRLLACIAEAHHDEHGLVWPISIAPYQVHLVKLVGRGKDAPDETSQIAEQIYQELELAGVEVLFDDRDESPGIKFNDADLIGLPIRLTVSERSLKNGGVEFKRRDQVERSTIALELVSSTIRAEIASLESTIQDAVVTVPFNRCH
jgi:prolyl-tRNA synthetase